MSTFLSAARTHPGRVRSRNEDAMLDRGQIGLWAVADGMGGHSRGDWASSRVVEGLAAIPPQDAAPKLMQEVKAAVMAAHDEIRAVATRDGGDGVIGCTVVALMAFGPYFASLWAGDSRLYRYRGGKLEQLSRDHSRVQEMIDANLLTPVEAKAHPAANVITRAVGVDELELDTLMDRFEPGDLLLLCTDGLDKMLRDEEIAECLEGRTVQEAVDELVDKALDRGGRDNVTVVLVQYPGTTAIAVPQDDDTICLAELPESAP